jgi:hypothetical protein
VDQIFRLADTEDYEAVLSIFKNAVRYMLSQKTDQWDEIYPNENTLFSDIKKQQMYLLLLDTKVVSVVVLSEEQEEEYKKGIVSFTKLGFDLVCHHSCQAS